MMNKEDRAQVALGLKFKCEDCNKAIEKKELYRTIYGTIYGPHTRCMACAFKISTEAGRWESLC